MRLRNPRQQQRARRKKKKNIQDYTQEHRGDVHQGLLKGKQNHKGLGAEEVGVEVVVERHEKGPKNRQADKKENEPQGSQKLKGKDDRKKSRR